MGWTLLKNSKSLQVLEKLSALQIKLTELVAKQKYNSLRMKLAMLRTEDTKDDKDGATKLRGS